MTPKFLSLSESIGYIWDHFSESAPLRFERYLLESGNRQLDAMAKYRWNVELCEALYPCLHTSELLLRNSIHRAMVEQYLSTSLPHHPDGSFPDEWWFDATTKLGALLDGRDYKKVEDAKAKLKGRPVTTPQVVAELNFGFWVDLLNPEYERTVVRPMLGTTMRRLKTGNRTQGWLRQHFAELRDLRNRVMHHEAIYEMTDLQHLNHLAWQVCKEVDPYMTNLLYRADRFDRVWTAGWKPTSDTLHVEARSLYANYRA